MNAFLIAGLDRGALDRMRQTLNCTHYELMGCKGSCALRQIRGRRYAAVVLDWDMKRTPAREIVAEAKSKDIPVIVLCHSVPEAMKGGEPYADIYLEKPVDTPELCAMLVAVALVNERTESRACASAEKAAAA